jgi:hypothetical protein
MRTSKGVEHFLTNRLKVENVWSLRCIHVLSLMCLRKKSAKGQIRLRST